MKNYVNNKYKIIVLMIIFVLLQIYGINTIVKIKAESLMSDNETVLCSIIGE